MRERATLPREARADETQKRRSERLNRRSEKCRSRKILQFQYQAGEKGRGLPGTRDRGKDLADAGRAPARKSPANQRTLIPHTRTPTRTTLR